MTHKPDGLVRRRPGVGLTWFVALMVVMALVLAACSGGEAPAAEPTAAVEAPAADAEEPAEEPTEEPAEEPTAEPTAEPTEEPAEEEAVTDSEAVTDTEALTDTEGADVDDSETVTDTEDAAPEATPAAEEEEAEAEATPAAEEEGAEAEATPAAEEEGAAPEATPAAEEEAATTGDAEAGGYLFTIARGCGCHFNRDLEALAGGNEFRVPGGEVYSRNITPDPDTGIGSLSEAEVAQLIHTGSLGDYHLHPVMPYRNYSKLSDEDALNLAAYLFSLEPVANEVPPRELETEPEPFTPESAPPATSPTDPVERGEMLVALARCGQCHTPLNEDGTPNMDLFLAGSRINEDEVAWNITPDEETGIGSWSEEELANFLRTGQLADGSEIVGTMAMNIERYFSNLTEDDAAAIAAYLMSLPPIENEPE